MSHEAPAVRPLQISSKLVDDKLRHQRLTPDYVSKLRLRLTSNRFRQLVTCSTLSICKSAEKNVPDKFGQDTGWHMILEIRRAVVDG